MFRTLSETMLVAGRQIRPDDMPAVTAEGISVLINNRPDGEEPGQPANAAIEAAARAAGLRYHHIPIAGGIGPDQVAAMAGALGEGKTLAFCRSGTRSTSLWALAARSRGMDGAAIIASIEAAGYDPGPLRPYLG